MNETKYRKQQHRTKVCWNLFQQMISINYLLQHKLLGLPVACVVYWMPWAVRWRVLGIRWHRWCIRGFVDSMHFLRKCYIWKNCWRNNAEETILSWRSEKYLFTFEWKSKCVSRSLIKNSVQSPALPFHLHDLRENRRLWEYEKIEEKHYRTRYSNLEAWVFCLFYFEDHKWQGNAKGLVCLV